MNSTHPEWFQLSEEAMPIIMQSVADAVSSNKMALQVRHIPTLAHWYMLDALLLANQANRCGMHANALSLTRQCLESLNVIEVGVCNHPDAESILNRWESDKISAGKLRAWLELHVWDQYGTGIWNESWSTFMREFSAALQPYAHYGSNLAKWQVRLLPGVSQKVSAGPITALIEMKPRAYDSQKATRITLFHGILVYALGRVCMAAHKIDNEFEPLLVQLGRALGASSYLDGHVTDWGRQFWAMVWNSDGNTELE